MPIKTWLFKLKRSVSLKVRSRLRNLSHHRLLYQYHPDLEELYTYNFL